MNLVTLLLGLNFALAAEPELPSFKYELSCAHMRREGVTTMIHAVIEFDGKANACEATNGRYIQYDLNYDIAFKCEKPIPLSVDKIHTIQAWVLKAEGPNDRITKLLLVMDHGLQKAQGFATAQDGTSFPVKCVKW